MSQAIIYLNFEKNTREAMNFYKDALGAELEIQLVKDSPMAGNMPPTVQDEVLHSTLKKDGITIMASDMCGMGILSNGNSAQICLDCDSEEQTRTFFNNLSQGATIMMPLDIAPWGALFGSFTDKFGKHWMFNYTVTK